MSLQPPSYLQTTFALDHVIPSGFYIHFTCTRTPYPNLAYREYNETEDNSEDDAVDGRFGLFCSDGAFVSRTWPAVEECVEKPLCFDFPKPPLTKRYKSLSKPFYTQGDYIYLECNDPDAILDDNSGRNYFPLYCQGDDQVGFFKVEQANVEGVDGGNASIASDNSTATNATSPNAANNATETLEEAEFIVINDTFDFPLCRQRCKNFYVGRLDFRAVDESIEVRAGDVAEFSCKNGYYIEGSDPPVSSIDLDR